MSLLDSLPTQEGHRGAVWSWRGPRASESWAVCGTVTQQHLVALPFWERVIPQARVCSLVPVTHH